MPRPRNSIVADNGQLLKHLAKQYHISYNTILYRYDKGVKMPELVALKHTVNKDARIAAELAGKVRYVGTPCLVCGSTVRYVNNDSCQHRRQHKAIRLAQEANTMP